MRNQHHIKKYSEKDALTQLFDYNHHSRESYSTNTFIERHQRRERRHMLPGLIQQLTSMGFNARESEEALDRSV